MPTMLTDWLKRFAVGLLATLLLPVATVLLLVAGWWLLVLLWHFPILLPFVLVGFAAVALMPREYIRGPRGGVYYMKAGSKRYI